MVFTEEKLDELYEKWQKMRPCCDCDDSCKPFCDFEETRITILTLISDLKESCDKNEQITKLCHVFEDELAKTDQELTRLLSESAD
jgi:hypothetical protein